MTRLSWIPLLGIATLASLSAGLPTNPENTAVPKPTWKRFSTGSDARFRGLAPVSDKIAWVSGTSGTVLRSTDGGNTWASVGPELSEADSALEFRDVEAWSADKAVILSIGEGNSSRIYVTDDGGVTWAQSFTNQEPTAFYDCIAFESAKRGMAMSDPVDGKIRLIETHDGGASWDIVDSDGMVPALEGESGFAASGTCLATTAGRWYVASGGVNPGRIFRSNDGHHWGVSDASITGGEGSGVFSVQFRDAKRGIAVGGNYSAPTGAINNAAWSKDGGVTWIPSKSFPSGYRSGSSWVPGRYNVALAVGPTGSDYTLDGGMNWHIFDNSSLDSVECVKGGTCWASGEKGAVARLVFA
ncbi:putative oxidoreductase protein [Daldinia childiae]|uniref:putative oxidoreductase protein n=1 Tax=Daldinia childiae TaxID=326645 RepID=UPI001448A005|nr:putative oxidoreductase protein [Daldinia childiae]KAF3059995.1 putative oxidoreductase protein [Daldinia childiae]